MPEETQNNPNSKEQKIVEKYYIEVNPSIRHKFLTGLMGGLGWGVGITLGTALLIYVVGILVSKIDFVPILGKLASDVIQSAQENLKAR